MAVVRRCARASAALASLAGPLPRAAASPPDRHHPAPCCGPADVLLLEAQDRVFTGHDGHVGPAGAGDLAAYQQAGLADTPRRSERRAKGPAPSPFTFARGKPATGRH